jgi:two-component system chemotaxis response regulator CheB
VGIVASTGGPAALAGLLSAVPSSFGAPILVVQHISAGFTRTLADWLDGLTPLRVSVAKGGEALHPGRVLIAPEERHMTLSTSEEVVLRSSPPVRGHRPSGTLLLGSLAEVYGAASVGVILTGMGDDGVEGLAAIRAAGGATIAEDETSAVVYGMPREAWEAGAAAARLPLDEIPAALDRLVRLSGTGSRRGRS